MSLKVLILLFFLSIFLSNPAIANKRDYALPEFTGEWYINGTSNFGKGRIYNGESYFDQCLTEQFIFKEKSIDKNGIIQEYINSLPISFDCQWKINEIAEYKSNAPATYLTSDWDEMPNKYYTTTYWLSCQKMVDGYEYSYDSAWITLEPIYNCPENTRIKVGVDGNHCSYKANLCLADVVGRDMNSDYFYWLGHVGLTNSNFYFDKGNTILEVLKPINNKDVIQENPFNIFVHSSASFWGSVYEYHSSPTLTFEQANDILLAGLHQSLFEAIYVLFAEYREGGMVPKTFFDYFKQKKNQKKIMQKAAFRCDTFVQFCYLKGANIYLNELTPKSMFNSFKKYRTALPIDSSTPLDQSYIRDKQLECNSNQCFEEKISQLIRDNSKSEDVLFVVGKYKQYLSNDTLFNSYILKAYKEHVASHRKIAYTFIDLLILNKPSDSIRNELVELYFESRATSIVSSLKLLSTFGEILTYPDDEIKKFSSDQIQRINRANEAVIEILKNSNLLSEVIEAINVAEQIMTNKHAEPLIFDALSRISSLRYSKKNKILERILFYQLANGSELLDLNSIKSSDFSKRLLVFLKYSDYLKLDKKNKDRLLNYLEAANYRNNLNPNIKTNLPQNIGDRLLWLSVIRKLGGDSMAMSYLNGYDPYTKSILVKSMRK